MAILLSIPTVTNLINYTSKETPKILPSWAGCFPTEGILNEGTLVEVSRFHIFITPSFPADKSRGLCL